MNEVCVPYAKAIVCPYVGNIKDFLCMGLAPQPDIIFYSSHSTGSHLLNKPGTLCNKLITSEKHLPEDSQEHHAISKYLLIFWRIIVPSNCW